MTGKSPPESENGPPSVGPGGSASGQAQVKFNYNKMQR